MTFRFLHATFASTSTPCVNRSHGAFLFLAVSNFFAIGRYTLVNAELNILSLTDLSEKWKSEFCKNCPSCYMVAERCFSETRSRLWLVALKMWQNSLFVSYLENPSLLLCTQQKCADKHTQENQYCRTWANHFCPTRKQKTLKSTKAKRMTKTARLGLLRPAWKTTHKASACIYSAVDYMNIQNIHAIGIIAKQIILRSPHSLPSNEIYEYPSNKLGPQITKTSQADRMYIGCRPSPQSWTSLNKALSDWYSWAAVLTRRRGEVHLSVGWGSALSGGIAAHQVRNSLGRRCVRKAINLPNTGSLFRGLMVKQTNAISWDTSSSTLVHRFLQ